MQLSIYTYNMSLWGHEIYVILHLCINKFRIATYIGRLHIQIIF